MAKRSTRTKIKDVKIEECAQAVINILESKGCNQPGKLMKKGEIVAQVPDMIEELRRNKAMKYKHIPTVNNCEVRIAQQKFVNRHWPTIRKLCSEYGYFLIYNPEGEGLGIRLGDVETFKAQQARLYAIAIGIAETHNEHAQSLRHHDTRAADVVVNITGEHK